MRITKMKDRYFAMCPKCEIMRELSNNKHTPTCGMCNIEMTVRILKASPSYKFEIKK